MIRITIGVEGMSCEHCEEHLEDTMKSRFGVKRARADHGKKNCEIVCESEIPEADLKAAVESCGYKFTSIKSESYVKKGFFATLLGK